MTTALVFVVLFGGLGAITWFMLVGEGKILASRVRQRLDPDEVITFESPASGMGMAITAFFSFRDGFLLLTQRRLLFGSWNLPPVWSSIKETPLEDIGSISVVSMWGLRQVHVSIQGKTMMLTPRVGRFIPFSNRRTDEFVAALKSVTELTIEETDIKGHIRNQIGQKR